MIRLLRLTYGAFIRDGGPRLAAAIAYHALFALAPLMLVAVAVAGLLFGEKAAVGEVAHFLESLMGPEGARLAESIVEAAAHPSAGAMAGVVGIGLMLYGSVRAFIQLQASLNVVWGVRLRPGLEWWKVVLLRLVPFALVAALTVGLVGALAMREALDALRDVGVSVPELLSGLAGTAFLMGVAYVAFALIYKYLPDVRVAWRDVWTGAAVTTCLLSLGTWAFQLYVTRSGVASIFGAAGSFVVIMLWVYYSAQIILLGAEFTEEHALMRGEPIRPAQNAVHVSRVIPAP